MIPNRFFINLVKYGGSHCITFFLFSKNERCFFTWSYGISLSRLQDFTDYLIGRTLFVQ